MMFFIEWCEASEGCTSAASSYNSIYTTEQVQPLYLLHRSFFVLAAQLTSQWFVGEEVPRAADACRPLGGGTTTCAAAQGALGGGDTPALSAPGCGGGRRSVENARFIIGVPDRITVSQQ